MRKVLTVLSSVLLVFALVSCATANTETRSTTINVSGSGVVNLTADVVTFTVSVSETADTTGEAQQATNKKVTKILEIIRSFGIEDKDITTASLSFSSEYYWDNVTGKQIKTGESVSQSLFVRMKNIDDFGALVDKLGASVSGISFYSVSFDAQDHSQAYIEARKLAYQDAYEKALAYAESAGKTLGDPLTINDGYASVSTRVSNASGKMMMAEAAAPDAYYTETPTGMLNVTANCDVVFELK